MKESELKKRNLKLHFGCWGLHSAVG